MEFVVECDIPPPPATLRANVKYPFREMQVGDSFFVPSEKVKKVRSAAFSAQKNGMKFTTRAVDDKGNYRCWRTA